MQQGARAVAVDALLSILTKHGLTFTNERFQLRTLPILCNLLRSLLYFHLLYKSLYQPIAE